MRSRFKTPLTALWWGRLEPAYAGRLQVCSVWGCDPADLGSCGRVCASTRPGGGCRVYGWCPAWQDRRAADDRSGIRLRGPRREPTPAARGKSEGRGLGLRKLGSSPPFEGGWRVDASLPEPPRRPARGWVGPHPPGDSEDTRRLAAWLAGGGEPGRGGAGSQVPQHRCSRTGAGPWSGWDRQMRGGEAPWPRGRAGLPLPACPVLQPAGLAHSSALPRPARGLGPASARPAASREA